MKVSGVGASFSKRIRPPHRSTAAAINFATRNPQYFILDGMLSAALRFRPRLQFGTIDLPKLLTDFRHIRSQTPRRKKRTAIIYDSSSEVAYSEQGGAFKPLRGH